MHWPVSADNTSDSLAKELLLVKYVKLGAFPKLCSILGGAGEGSAHDLAFSMLLSMSTMPEVAQLVADRDEMRSIAKVGGSGMLGCLGAQEACRAWTVWWCHLSL
eukprot:GHUV01036458.1.p1 GENE.GHUV01036458.1~~GHUV01036458.1.p1  ORF type:complete len:105 (-),score=30.05 GHUV01036458.1:443-757(-)